MLDQDQIPPRVGLAVTSRFVDSGRTVIAAKTTGIVHKRPRQTTFELQTWRWVVERTFAWFGRYRRLSKD